MSKTSLLPDDLRDYLSIVSFIGFIGIFFEYALGNSLIAEMMTPLFLIVGGAGLMVVGKVFSITRWARDGIQKNEVSQLFSVVFGITSMILGVLLWLGTELPLTVQGFVGFLALAPAIYIFFDYLAKNK
jgi:hypothetical protein